LFEKHNEVELWYIYNLSLASSRILSAEI
jgi:hypothetical protein